MSYLLSALALLEAAAAIALVGAAIYALVRADDLHEVREVAVGQVFAIKSSGGAIILACVGVILLGFSALAFQHLR